MTVFNKNIEGWLNVRNWYVMFQSCEDFIIHLSFQSYINML